MSNNRAEIWAREARLRDVIKMPRKRKIIARSIESKRQAVYWARFAPAVYEIDPPFALRAGEWSVWGVSDSDGRWTMIKQLLHPISAYRYSNWLNATRHTDARLKFHFVARVRAPEVT